jgi:hypothetical protein
LKEREIPGLSKHLPLLPLPPSLPKKVVSSHSLPIVIFTGAHSTFYKGHDSYFFWTNALVMLAGPIFRDQGVYIASSNFAAMFGYSEPSAMLPTMFDQKVIQNLLTPTQIGPFHDGKGEGLVLAT